MNHRVSRREFIAASASLMAASYGNETASATAADARPNVLLLHVDQHRFDCLGMAKHTEIRTPHIDALAAQGVVFENSFCPHPVCTPSRYSLLSGQYVFEHGGWSNHCTLHPDIATFPKVMRHAGYKTKAVGKMHFTPTYLDVGFDEMVLAEQDGPGRWDDDYHRHLKEHNLHDRNDLEDQLTQYRFRAPQAYWDSFGTMPSNLPEAHHSTTWVADRAMETIDQWSNSGNLLMAGFIKPHHPFDPPEEWCTKYDPETLRLLPGYTEKCLERDLLYHKGYFPHERLTEDTLKKTTAYYYALIEQIDFHIGRIITALQRKGLYDNTMIIFTSDHGEYMGFHHMLLKGNYLYDPLAKTPLIIKYPRQMHSGKVSSVLVSAIDIAPTILAQAGCPTPKSMAGLNLAEDKERDIVFAEAGRSQVMARTDRYKLILVPALGQHYFFDLEQDPYELEDQYDTHRYQQEVNRLTSALEAWRPLDIQQHAYLDEDAPVIQQPNVRKHDDGHRKAIQAYFANKMRG